MAAEKEIVRQPVVAGMFYPETKIALQQTLDEFFSSVHVQPVNGKVLGLVAPHAGYIYSGSTAACAYQLLHGRLYDAVIVIGPSHREYFDSISIYSGDAYETPFGTVAVHKEIREKLLSFSPHITSSRAGHRTEHSIEVQIPFLQYMVKDFSFVPIVIGNQTKELCGILGNALAHIGEHYNILMVASSDLSHYHPYDEAVSLDRHLMQFVENFDPDVWMTEYESENIEACGGGPIGAVMAAAKKLGATKAEILQYCNSGDTSGNRSGVVGYLAAAFIQPD